jgi:hypothetical protein
LVFDEQKNNPRMAVWAVEMKSPTKSASRVPAIVGDGAAELLIDGLAADIPSKNQEFRTAQMPQNLQDLRDMLDVRHTWSSSVRYIESPIDNCEARIAVTTWLSDWQRIEGLSFCHFLFSISLPAEISAGAREFGKWHSSTRSIRKKQVVLRVSNC